MIVSLLLIAAAQTLPVPPALGPIGQQSLPARGCAAYLWNTRDRQLVAMAVAEPATIRLAVDGRTIDLARVGAGGTGPLGFDATTRYASADLAATLEMTVVPRENLTAGAQVQGGTLTVQRPGQDALVEPVGGLVGCVS